MNEKVAIIGPGNIGIDLMYKIKRSNILELALFVGRRQESKGLALGRKEGVETSHRGIDDILERDDIRIVLDATGAKGHLIHAPLLKEAGKIAIDLTPAAVGPYVIPCVNLDQHLDADNINLITCGGQATIPIVAAVSRVAKVKYGEIVATIASKSAGKGTRQNIDEFTQTTARGIQIVGKAERGKAIIILNPAEPPIIMRDTIYTIVDNSDEKAITESIQDMVCELQSYVPGYRLKVGPLFDGNRVTTMVEVEGAGDYLPKYSGNLDIINAAAVAMAERIVKEGGSGP